uniref:Uncharacterized protein n=1 Tax=Oryza nivara TaxID=4536 RepID=A0A0E0FL53_ORYNI
MFSGMHADLYYASLARGLLIEPQPPLTIVEGCCDDEGYGGAEMELSNDGDLNIQSQTLSQAAARAAGGWCGRRRRLPSGGARAQGGTSSPAGEAEEVRADVLALVVDVATDDEVRAAHQLARFIVIDTHHLDPAVAPPGDVLPPWSSLPASGR